MPGRSSPLDEYLRDGPESFGFRRDSFPLEYNGHRIHLLHNDAYVLDDERLQVHFTLYCSECDSEFTLRGRSNAWDGWSPQHLQDAKVLILGPFVDDECPIGGRGGRI